MSRVDFYILTQAEERARQVFACKLAEKAWRLNHSVYIHTKDRGDAERLDELLWTFRDGSFVPHGLGDSQDGTEGSPIVIGCSTGDIATRDLLINLGDEIPSFAEGFPRIAELVSSDADSRQMSRKRYASYRDGGHELNTHKL